MFQCLTADCLGGDRFGSERNSRASLRASPPTRSARRVGNLSRPLPLASPPLISWCGALISRCDRAVSRSEATGQASCSSTFGVEHHHSAECPCLLTREESLPHPSARWGARAAGAKALTRVLPRAQSPEIFCG